jgi:hypothetical protein
VITWGKGSSFNVNLGDYNGWGAERYRTVDGKRWKFMITSTTGQRYQHFDSREFETKEEVDEEITKWINANEFINNR